MIFIYSQVKVNGDSCIHIRVYENVEKKCTLNYVLYGRTLTDPLDIMY